MIAIEWQRDLLMDELNIGNFCQMIRIRIDRIVFREKCTFHQIYAGTHNPYWYTPGYKTLEKSKQFQLMVSSMTDQFRNFSTFDFVIIPKSVL